MTDLQWHAILTRDPAQDGQFWYGSVRGHTFCLPSCPGRHPLRDNILIFATPEEAIAQGRKPCSRCHPDIAIYENPKKALADRARRFIEDNYKEKYTLDHLAKCLYVNKFYLQRVYKEITGDTLLHYHNHVRCEHAKQLMTHSNLSMTEIAFQIGYTSPAHFSRVFSDLNGCNPTLWRSQIANGSFQDQAAKAPDKTS